MRFPPSCRGDDHRKLRGSLAQLDALRDTNSLFQPATIRLGDSWYRDDVEPRSLHCCGTWSLVGTLIDAPLTTNEAVKAGFTNQAQPAVVSAFTPT